MSVVKNFMVDTLDKNEKTKTEFITSENEHWYPSKRKARTWYPSVTTILSIWPKGVGFNRWLSNQPSYESSQETLKDAGKQGTNVHKATEELEAGETLERGFYTLNEWQMLEGFVKWHKKYKPICVNMELPVISDKLKTGGTIDRIYKIDGEFVILDIKTSGAIHDNYWIQVATYAELFEENHELEIGKTAILRLAPRTKLGYQYVTRERDEFIEDFKIFKSVQEIWNHINPKAQPKIIEVPKTLKL